MSSAIDIEYDLEGSPRRKVSFRPHSDGGFHRVTFEWNGCQWRETGHESVEDVTIECADGVLEVR